MRSAHGSDFATICFATSSRRTLRSAARQLADRQCAPDDGGRGRSSRHPHSGRYLEYDHVSLPDSVP